MGSINTAIMEALYIKRGIETERPAFATQGFEGGHLFINTVDGTIWRNLGNNSYSLHSDLWSNRQVLEDRFLQTPGLNANRDVPAGDAYNTAQMQLGIDRNPNFELLGTNMTSALCTFADGGGITLTTAGAQNDQAILLPHLNTKASQWAAAKWNTEDEISFEAVIKTGASVTATTIWAGFKLTNTPVTATDDDQVFFRLQDTVNGGKWQCIGSNTNVDDARDSGVLGAVSTTYVMRIQVNGDRVPSYYLNGVLVGTGNPLKANVDLIPYIGVQADAAAAKAITVRGERCGKTHND